MSASPHDDAEIKGNEIIIRRINPKFHVVEDKNTGRMRVSSKAYDKSSPLNEGMSIDLETPMLADKIDPKAYVCTPAFTGAVSFLASSVRNLQLWVGRDPIVEGANTQKNPYHGQVWGHQPRKGFSAAQKAGLAAAASWYVEIPGVDIK